MPSGQAGPFRRLRQPLRHVNQRAETYPGLVSAVHGTRPRRFTRRVHPKWKARGWAIMIFETGIEGKADT